MVETHAVETHMGRYDCLQTMDCEERLLKMNTELRVAFEQAQRAKRGEWLRQMADASEAGEKTSFPVFLAGLALAACGIRDDFDAEGYAQSLEQRGGMHPAEQRFLDARNRARAAEKIVPWCCACHGLALMAALSFWLIARFDPEGARYAKRAGLDAADVLSTFDGMTRRQCMDTCNEIDACAAFAMPTGDRAALRGCTLLRGWKGRTVPQPSLGPDPNLDVATWVKAAHK